MNMNYFKLKLLDNLLEDYQSHYLINIHKPQEFNSVLALRYNIMLDLHYIIIIIVVYLNLLDLFFIIFKIYSTFIH